jgi:hypothetical protein
MYGLCCNKHVNDLFVIVFEANKFDFRYSRDVAAPPFVQCNVFASIHDSLRNRIHKKKKKKKKSMVCGRERTKQNSYFPIYASLFKKKKQHFYVCIYW